MKDVRNFRRAPGGVVFMLDADIFSRDMVEYALGLIGRKSSVSKMDGLYEVFIEAENKDVNGVCVEFNDALISGVRLTL